MLNTHIRVLKQENYFHYFSFNEQLKFHAKLN